MGETVRFSLSDGMDLAGVGLEELWGRYLGLGGTADPASMARSVRLGHHGEQHEHNLIAQALNELFLDRQHATFPVAYAGASLFDGTPAEPGMSVPAVSPAQPDARHQARLARLRSSLAAQQSARLHAMAAELMQTSGQLQFARHARNRARAAQQRAIASGGTDPALSSAPGTDVATLPRR